MLVVGIGTVVTFAIILVIGLSKEKGWLPALPAPDPNDPPRARDRWTYYGANALALIVGVLLALALLASTPPPDVPWRFSPFDGAGRFLGPFFVALGLGGAVLPWIAHRLVRPGPLVHILHEAAEQWWGADVTRLLIRVGLIVATLAIALHFTLLEMHVTFEARQVRWRDWPWSGEQRREWSRVDDIRIVRTFEAMAGNVVERPHLVIRFEDGAEVVTGKGNTRPEAFWEEPARYASERSGVPVRHVEK